MVGTVRKIGRKEAQKSQKGDGPHGFITQATERGHGGGGSKAGNFDIPQPRTSLEVIDLRV